MSDTNTPPPLPRESSGPGQPPGPGQPHVPPSGYGPPQQPHPYGSGQYGSDQHGSGQYAPGQYVQQPGYYGPPGTQPYPEQKSKIVAGILGILLGGFGIHRFYLGYIGIGIAQIVVTLITLGFGSIWGLIEGTLILVGADPFKRDAKGIPLRDS